MLAMNCCSLRHGSGSVQMIDSECTADHRLSHISYAHSPRRHSVFDARYCRDLLGGLEDFLCVIRGERSRRASCGRTGRGGPRPCRTPPRGIPFQGLRRHAADRSCGSPSRCSWRNSVLAVPAITFSGLSRSFGVRLPVPWGLKREPASVGRSMPCRRRRRRVSSGLQRSRHASPPAIVLRALTVATRP